jgi:hypothetical protein
MNRLLPPLAIIAACLTLALALPVIGGCSSPHKSTSGPPSTNVCPESRSLKCLAVVSCQADEERGCAVCVCTGEPKPQSPDDAAQSAASAGDDGSHYKYDYPK